MRRGICKVCRKRRQVSVGSYRCRECSAQSVESSPTSTTTEPVPYIPASPTVYADSWAMRQLQMLAVFLNAHTPVVQHRRPGDAVNLSYFAQLPQMNLSSPLLGNAVESLCFAHMGRSRDDPRLVEASRDRYGKTLSSLGKVIQTPHLSPKGHRETVTSIMLISLYDESMPLGHRARNNWMTHWFGLQKYLEAAGPSTFASGDRADVLLLGNLSSPMYVLNLARRTRIVFSRPDWRSTLDLTVVLRTWYPYLLDLPGILEEIDDNMQYSTSGLDALFTELDETHATQSRWFLPGLEGEHLQIPQDGLDFRVDIEEHCFMASNETFKSFFRFSHPMMASRATIVWLSRLIAECTLLRIMYSNPQRFPLLKESGRTPKAVENDAFRLAVKLCLSVHYLSSLASLAHADYICVLMEVAQTFFTEASAWKEMGWCQALLMSTESRMARVKPTMPPTLCRIRDLAPDLAAGVRYRSWTGFVQLPHRIRELSESLET